MFICIVIFNEINNMESFMKIFKFALPLLFTTLTAGFSVHADISTTECSGKAYIPSWSKHFISSTQYGYVQFSNISTSKIIVRIELFDESGNLYTEDTETGSHIYYQGDNLVGNPLAPSSATLEAKSTGTLRVWHTGVEHFGYGVIKWESTSSECSGPAMIATYIRVMSPSGYLAESQTPINSGMPF
jgi:hypothetical protein